MLLACLLTFFIGLFFALIPCLILISRYKQKYNELKQNVQVKEEQKLSREALEGTFAVLSQKTLQSNQEMFLKMAQSSLEKVLLKAEGQFAEKENNISHLVKPLQETLKKMEDQHRNIELKQREALGGLTQQLDFLIHTSKELKQETGRLIGALKKPQVRGRWGEMTLKRVVELAGLVEHCDFYEQVSVSQNGSIIRPDMLVNLPDNRQIVVDSKVPLQAYLDALETSSSQTREECLRQHSQQVVRHMKDLAKKSYWDQFDLVPEFVVMFIPGESFFSVALEYEKNLIEEGISQKVIIATPTTLIALLRSVAYGWRQEQLTRNAEEISNLGKELYDRMTTFVNAYGKVGKNLEKATESFNQSVGSLESRVLVSARKFKEMGVSTKHTLEKVDIIDRRPRQVDGSSKS